MTKLILPLLLLVSLVGCNLSRDEVYSTIQTRFPNTEIFVDPKDGCDVVYLRYQDGSVRRLSLLKNTNGEVVVMTNIAVFTSTFNPTPAPKKDEVKP